MPEWWQVGLSVWQGSREDQSAEAGGKTASSQGIVGEGAEKRPQLASALSAYWFLIAETWVIELKNVSSSAGSNCFPRWDRIRSTA